MPRKRARDEADLDSSVLPVEQSQHNEALQKLRNMWQLASLMQYIHIFGSVVKIDDDLDVEVRYSDSVRPSFSTRKLIHSIQELEEACMQPQHAEKLGRIGLQMLKYVSSHRGLTYVTKNAYFELLMLTRSSPELFDEYTRRQYLAKAPARNPFGEEEEPQKFNEFDVYTKIKVLQQLSTWTFNNAERIRAAMPEVKDSEQIQWVCLNRQRKSLRLTMSLAY